MVRTEKRLFKNQLKKERLNVERIQGVCKAIHDCSSTLDHDKLDVDMNQADVTAAIEQDIQDGQTLGVKATPGFFVNGQPLPSFGYAQLRKLVADAVDDAY